MSIPTIQIGSLAISRFILGANPFSGFSHQSKARDNEMRHYYTSDRIKTVLHHAEVLGINAHISRADHHVMRLLMEYWDHGGSIQWIAQTCPELGPIDQSIKNATQYGAKACYIHGGVMDNLYFQQGLDQIPAAIEKIKKTGMSAGIAGHIPAVFEWAEQQKLDVDFYMCAYYNPIPRTQTGEHIAGTQEVYDPAHRNQMAQTIKSLSKPVIHYKIMAAGRNNPKEAFAFVAEHLRSQDAVCVGVFTKGNPKMLEVDVELFLNSLRRPA